MEKTNYITEMFFDQMNKGEGVINDGLFSEEGGRFYHEQNRNVILLMTTFLRKNCQRDISG